jgi:hypothetical protein
MTGLSKHQKRKAKSEKRKAKSEKRKAKSNSKQQQQKADPYGMTNKKTRQIQRFWPSTSSGQNEAQEQRQ